MTASIVGPFRAQPLNRDSLELMIRLVFRGDRRGLNPRQLEPQSSNNAIFTRVCEFALGQSGPQNPASGQATGPGAHNAAVGHG
jgi:hypothetical protein